MSGSGGRLDEVAGVEQDPAPREGTVNPPGASGSARAAGAPAASGAIAADEAPAAPMSLGRRLRQPRTIISILLPILILVLLVVSLPGFHLDKLPGTLLAANFWLLLAALATYYVGFPLRGYRWSLLLRGAGTPVGVRDATEILFISWLVNCVVPVKLGDIFRAWLLRMNYLVSLTRTLGTVFIERILDLFAIVLLGLAAGFWSFRSGLPPEIQALFAVGLVIVGLLALGLFTLRNFGRRVLDALPVPDRFREMYQRFEEGVFAINRRLIPELGILTALIWATEAGRLYLVIGAFGFSDVHMGISGAFFVALAASLLTAVPLTPAGLGLVEAGIVGILAAAYGVGSTEAAAIAVADRAISVLSVIVIGGIVYLASDKTKGTQSQAAAGEA